MTTKNINYLLLNQDNEINIDGYSNIGRNKHILSKYDIRTFSDSHSLSERNQIHEKKNETTDNLLKNELSKDDSTISKNESSKKSESGTSKKSESGTSKDDPSKNLIQKLTKDGSSKSKSSKNLIQKLTKDGSSKSDSLKKLKKGLTKYGSSKSKSSKNLIQKLTKYGSSKSKSSKNSIQKLTKYGSSKSKSSKSRSSFFNKLSKKSENKLKYMNSITKNTFNDVKHKLDKGTLEATIRLINNKINSMIDDIKSIPQPLHKSYKFFLNRLKSLLKNKKLFSKFVIKVTDDNSLVDLLQVEKFDNESYNSIDNAIENKLLESFAEEDFNNTSNSIKYVNGSNEYFNTPNNQNLFIYLIIGIFLYMIYKNYNK